MRSEIASTARVWSVALGDRDQLDIEARTVHRQFPKADMTAWPGVAAGARPPQREADDQKRHAVVTVPIANSVGDVALEISA